jgi:hypothetical protein
MWQKVRSLRCEISISTIIVNKSDVSFVTLASYIIFTNIFNMLDHDSREIIV